MNSWLEMAPSRSLLPVQQLEKTYLIVLLFYLMPRCCLVLITVLAICFENPSFSPLPWLSFTLASLCLPVSVGQRYQSFHGNCFTFCPSSFCLTLFAGISLHIYCQSWIYLSLTLDPDFCLLSVPFPSLLPSISPLSSSSFLFLFIGSLMIYLKYKILVLQ